MANWRGSIDAVPPVFQSTTSNRSPSAKTASIRPLITRPPRTTEKPRSTPTGSRPAYRVFAKAFFNFSNFLHLKKVEECCKKLKKLADSFSFHNFLIKLSYTFFIPWLRSISFNCIHLKNVQRFTVFLPRVKLSSVVPNRWFVLHHPVVSSPILGSGSRR